MRELKPCPFCGSDAEAFDLAGYEIWCKECSAQVMSYSGTLDDAVAAWNARAVNSDTVNFETVMRRISRLLEDIMPQSGNIVFSDYENLNSLCAAVENWRGK
jgi:Lar family restriction alleviation protein